MSKKHALNNAKSTWKSRAYAKMLSIMALTAVVGTLSGCPGSKGAQPEQPSLPTGRIEGYIFYQQFNTAKKAGREAEATTAVNTDVISRACLNDQEAVTEEQIAALKEQKPMMGATVTANGLGLTTTTDVFGYFTLHDVPIGGRQLTVTKEGYGTITLNVSVGDGKIYCNDQAPMVPSVGGTLTINSTPLGATVYINNVNTKQVTPYTFNPISAGSHVVYVTKTGYETPTSKALVVTENDVTQWTFLLKELQPVLVGIEIRRDTALGNWLLWTGTSTQFIADCLFSDGSTEVCTAAVTWESSDTVVGSVSEHSGLFQAKIEGTTQLTISLVDIGLGDEEVTYTDNVFVTVLKSELDTISVTPLSTTVKAGLQQQFSARCRNTDGTERSCTDLVTWASSDNSKGTVSSNGLFTAIAEGSTEITAEYQGKISPPAEVTIAPPQLNSISVTPFSLSVAAGLSNQFIASCAYSNAKTESCTTKVDWTSNDLAVGSVGLHTGLFTGVAQGQTTVFASLSGVSSNTSTAIVTPPNLKKIVVSPPTQDIFAGMVVTNLQANCEYTDGTTSVCTDIYWAFAGVTDTDKASIDPTTGYVINTKNGTVTVIATSGDGTIISAGATIRIKPTTTLHGYVYKVGTTIPVGSADISFNYSSGTLTGSTRSNATTGEYSLTGVPTANVDLKVTATNYEDYTLTNFNPAVSSEKNFEIVPILRKFAVSGTVTDSVTLAPLQGVEVELIADVLGADVSMGIETTNASGTYTFAEVEESTYTHSLTAFLDGYIEQTILIGTINSTKSGKDVALVPAP